MCGGRSTGPAHPAAAPGGRAQPRPARWEPDKFTAAGFRVQPSQVVRPPRVAGCPIQLDGGTA
ncbi:hypothetical protein BLA24_13195 [Streptomyces cinnamoneus]|uniref:Uncharacterized protein n=1 Tax=Streptomyces cinnamoneus TaxID=53446 RepID=A0A2G1XJR1_STRCJ|nr:hypothetical protein BLA24_13195 [Streptomyces cinnamoneus]